MGRTGEDDPCKQSSTSEIFGINGHRFVLNRENSTFAIHLIEGSDLKRSKTRIRQHDLEERVRHAETHGRNVVQMHVGSTIVTEKTKKIKNYLKRQAKIK